MRGPCDTATQLRGKGGPGGYPFAGLGKGGEGHITWKKRQEEGEGRKAAVSSSARRPRPGRVERGGGKRGKVHAGYE